MAGFKSDTLGHIVVVRHAERAYQNGDGLPLFDAGVVEGADVTLPDEVVDVLNWENTIILCSPYERCVTTCARFVPIERAVMTVDAAEYLGNQSHYGHVDQNDPAAVTRWLPSTIVRANGNTLPSTNETIDEFRKRCCNIADIIVRMVSIGVSVGLFTHGFTARTVIALLNRRLQGLPSTPKHIEQMGYWFYSPDAPET